MLKHCARDRSGVRRADAVLDVDGDRDLGVVERREPDVPTVRDAHFCPGTNAATEQALTFSALIEP